MDFFVARYILFVIPALVIGYIADLIIGDPHGIWHPICMIGKMITLFERGLRSVFSCPVADSSAGRVMADAGESDTDRAMADAGESDTDGSFSNREFTAGIFLVILVLFCTIALTALILMIGYRIHWAVGLILQSYMSYTILATKSLRVESMKVYTALKKEGLEAGRQAVSMIVGRDTESLDEISVTKAAVETVAENTSDGVIAPLIFLVIGGPILGYFYKAVNTMDSMVGYKNERYRHFGTAAARLDDVLNYLPARISAVLMIAAAAILSVGERRRRSDAAMSHHELQPELEPDKDGCKFMGKLENGGSEIEKRDRTSESDLTAKRQTSFCMDARNARKIWRRDRRKHASPNSAQTESVMAGALGIQLAGDAWYFGVKHEKQTIGDALRQVETEDIVRANRLMYATSILAWLLFLFVRWILMAVFSGF